MGLRRTFDGKSTDNARTISAFRGAIAQRRSGDLWPEIDRKTLAPGSGAARATLGESSGFLEALSGMAKPVRQAVPA